MSKLKLTHRAVGRGFDTSRVGIRIGLVIHNFWIASSDEKDGVRGTTVSLGNLITKLTYHHSCHTLVATHISPGAMWEGTTQGCEQQEAGIIHLAGWLAWSPR